jgi:Protein of unknown function (DUF3455)
MRRSLPLLLAPILIVASSAQAQKESPTAPLPDQHPFLTLTGKGVQIYACQQVDNAPKWVFQGPEATLFDEKDAKVGTHAAGPVWKYQDGSVVKGEVLAKNPAPNPDAIPWLLLRAVSSEGSGVMTRVDSIRRTGTQGGLAPATGCDADHLNAVVRVPYSATYTFYSVRP